MKRFLLLACLALTGCQGLGHNVTDPQPTYDDLATVEKVTPGQVYRMGDSGICGLVEPGVIKVTSVIPGSPADGKIQVGDEVTALQYRGLGGDVRRTVAKRIFRLGRDWHWRIHVTVNRPSLREGQGNALTYLLTMPMTPGSVHHLGPTGLYAKVYPDHLVVEKLADGSPAAATLQVGDRIVAVDGEPIGVDLFTQWTEAIDRSESQIGGGRLPLTIQRTEPLTSLVADDTRSGVTDPIRTFDVMLQLETLGSYASTAPINCPKTNAIITQTADALVAAGKHDRMNIELLGLLATGEKSYIDYVGQVLRNSDYTKPDYQTSLSAGMVSWHYAYHLLVMCEYYLLTGDEFVLPAIRKHATTISQGQDAAGLWNHRMANPDANFGQLNGRLYGYGAINQTSVALWMGLILAEKCGIDDTAVRRAVEKTHNLYSNWIDRGALPYGNHGYMEGMLTNNGTSGSAAVAFALLGHREGARHFAALSAASHDEVLTGHTGPYFNNLWSGLGASVLGPEVAAGYNQKVHWLRTTTRRFDHRFHYMIARGGAFEYKNASATGANLLNLCVGRRAIHITGKQADQALWLTGQAAVDAVEGGQIRDTSPQGLLAALGHPLPRVRLEAAQRLAIADHNVTTDVMKLLQTGNREQRIGAIHAIRQLKIASATDALMDIAENEADDLWVRVLAIGTLAEFEQARRHASHLLDLLLVDRPNDARGDISIALGRTLNALLQPDPFEHDLDKRKFYEAVNRLLAHRRQDGRGVGMALIRDVPLEEFAEVADAMLQVIEDKDRTYTSYHGDGHRQAGLEILNRLNIETVIPLTINTIKEPTGRGGPRTRGRMRLLNSFTGEAKPTSRRFANCSATRPRRLSNRSRRRRPNAT